MRKSIIVGAVVLVAVTVGAVYLTGDSTDQRDATTPPAAQKTTPAAQSAGASNTEAPRPADSPPLDPRLVPLQVSPANDLIKFVLGENGKVIAEIDQDPTSASFGKPTREYLYFADKIVALTEYRYSSNQVEVTRTRVSYKPDGSVDEVQQTFENEPPR